MVETGHVVEELLQLVDVKTLSQGNEESGCGEMGNVLVLTGARCLHFTVEGVTLVWSLN
jgi:hypothetical protein